MQITTQYITVRDLSRNYIDQGVFTYNPNNPDYQIMVNGCKNSTESTKEIILNE